MAKRLLLTFLALLGLAAQAAPAEAAGSARAASALVVAAEASAMAVAPTGAAARPVQSAHWRFSADLPVLAAMAPLGAPVLIGIDRARE